MKSLTGKSESLPPCPYCEKGQYNLCGHKPQEVNKCCGAVKDYRGDGGNLEICSNCLRAFKPQEDCQKCGYYICRCEVKPFVKESDWESEEWIEKQFILNILDGIDKADEQMGNKGGGTKAIRFALESRIPTTLAEIKLQQRQDLLKELEEEVGKKKFMEKDLSKTENLPTNIYNQALNDVLALIKSKRK